jgi:hypothetical protein
MPKVSNSRPGNRGGGQNVSGKGPRYPGAGPARAKPMVKTPSGPKSTPSAAGKVRARTGGGEGSNPHVKVKHVGGSPNVRKVDVGAVADFGNNKGTHVTDSGGRETNRPNTPLYKQARDYVPMGNEVAKNVGRGGVGTGRILYGQAGSQGTYGKPVAGNPPPSGELFPGWPAKKG